MSLAVNKSTQELGFPNLVSNYRTPTIFWYQTDYALFIRINLMNVRKHYLKVEHDIFQFGTTVDHIKYFIGIKLFGAVIPEKTSHVRLGREVKVCLIKALKFTDWPRLPINKEKNLHIVIDPDHIVKKSWENPYAKWEERESFAEYRKRNNIFNIPPADSSSSGSDSDDEKMIGYD